MTSNLGSDILLDGIGENGEITEEARKSVSELLKRSFRPEFLNRLDEIIFFKPLTKNNINAILDLMLGSLSKRLIDKELTLNVTDRARDYIAENGYDPVYGARPLRRFIQSRLETLIARAIIRDDPKPGSTLTVDLSNGDLIIT